MKTQQKYQYLAAMHQAADDLYKIGEQMDVLYRAYWANDFGPGAANAITEQEADENNFSLEEIAAMIFLAEQFTKYFNGEAPLVTDCRRTLNSARMTFMG